MNEPSLEDLQEHIESCFHMDIPSRDYIMYLGLPHTAKGNRPRFKDGPIKVLYDATGVEIERFAKRFTHQGHLRATVREADTTFIDNVVDVFFRKYGPDVWCSSHTELLPSCKHKVYLSYNNAVHAAWIKLHLFCWLVKRAFRDLSAAPVQGSDCTSNQWKTINSDNGKKRDHEFNTKINVLNTARRTSRRNQGKRQPNYTPHWVLEQDQDSSDELGGTPADKRTQRDAESTGLQLSGTILVSDIREMPSRSVEAARVTEIPRATSSVASPAVRNSTTSPTTTDTPVSLPVNTSPGNPDVIRQIKRRSSSLSDPPEEFSDKRRRLTPREEHAQSEPRSRTPTDTIPVLDSQSQDCYTEPMPQPWQLGSDERVLAPTINGLPLPETNNVAAPDFEVGSSLQSHVEEYTSDTNSVQGSIGPSSFAKGKSAMSVSQGELRKNRLGLGQLLIDVSRAEFHHYKASQLAELVDLVQKIEIADMQRLKEAYGAKLEVCQTILNRWLRCVRGLITFNKDTEFEGTSGFEGDKNERSAFLKRLPIRQRFGAMHPVQAIYMDVADWLQEPGFTLESFSYDLAYVFLQMTAWIDDDVSQDDLSELLIEFNTGLISWFTSCATS